MSNQTVQAVVHPNRRMRCAVAFATMLAGVLLSPLAQAVTINVVDSQGTALPTGFRWLVEEDATFPVTPGVLDPQPLAVRFHRSYMPVVSRGRSAGSSASINVPADKTYFISVLPDSGYSNSGTKVEVGQTEATVKVSSLPLPTAQLTVFVFGDNNPINNEPDLPAESGLEGFKVVLYEAGGTYGASGGQMMQDIFGNPLGTTYDADGNVTMMGDGIFSTDANGEVTIKNLGEGKYTVQAVPPAGENWIQTSTIEGTKGNDAWVKPNEPKFFVEFGPPGPHVFLGFVKAMNDTSVLSGGKSISGQIVNLHNSRPPLYTFHAGEPVPHAWVGLNDLSVGGGKGVYAAPCDPDAKFSIPNVPPGSYQLVVWDDPLDIIFASKPVTVTDAGDVDLGTIPVFNWFARVQNQIFADPNENGFRDPGEEGISDQVCNLRFRDGSIYASATTDPNGFLEFHETFPFFNWLIAEVDYTRFKPTGATVIVDNGGPVLPDAGWNYPSRNILTPQPQFQADGTTPLINPNTGNNLSRTDTGPAFLLEGIQTFLGQTNIIEWGKSTYNRVDKDNPPEGNFPGPEDVDQNGNGWFDGSNGGIAGIVHYATTRAEEDPRYAAAENWEPGIPRVQVNLYQDSNRDTVIDDLNNDGHVTLADVDNYPFNWTDPAPGQQPQIGPEDIDRNGNGIFDLGDAINYTRTDSWDDLPPTACQGPPFVLHGQATDCYDGLRNFNQVRPGVFDGGYIFLSPTPNSSKSLPEGTYIVEAVAPPGYELQKEEDRNVTFGDTYTPTAAKAMAKSGLLELYPPCVGDLRLVPAELSLFPGQPCVFGGQMRPLPDRKEVVVTNGQNAPCDFHMFTEVPIAGHIVGIILDDLANEFDQNSPMFGEKYAPPWLPISIRDWEGNEVSRVYADEYGAYNALVPSTYTIDPPFPSGVTPKMMTVVLNSPGPILDKNPASPTYNQYITDPQFNRQYSQFSYTFQYDPGKTTYLDTPVVPVAAYTGANQSPLDCDFPDKTPVIWSVENGPYVPAPGRDIVVVSAGMVEVPNPEYDGPGGSKPKTILRDYTFGTKPGNINVDGTRLRNVIWTPGSIKATLPFSVKSGQLNIIRGDNLKVAPVGIHLTVGPISGTVRQVQPSAVPGATPIQNAIDGANPGDLILVAPGTYDELVILWKPVQLQGWGAPSVTINAVKAPAEKLQLWRAKVESLVMQGAVDLLPGQDVDFIGTNGEPTTLFTEEGAGILVMGRNLQAAQGGFGKTPNARIDGLTVTGADHGGGVMVNGYAHYLEISNNRIAGNQGFYGGGIRIGHPFETWEGLNGLEYWNGHNDNIRIHHNHIEENGGLGGAGGGISLCTGTDYYQVTDNVICGNFNVGSGGGIGHLGKSLDGLIAHNLIIFNQSFDQGTNPSGGGIYISGGASPGAAGLTPGSGSVTIDGNIIQGNQAGAGDGGGISAQFINGQDVVNAAGNARNWYYLNIVNNIIANNMTGLAGGGIALQDAAKVNIINNTIAHNDSTATAGLAFAAGNPNASEKQPAGVVSRSHSAALTQAMGGSPRLSIYAKFSNPTLVNNIIYKNRSFYFQVNPGGSPAFDLLPLPTAPYFWDLGVLGTAQPAKLSPGYCDLTSRAGYESLVGNITQDPLFVAQYFNGTPNQTIQEVEYTTAIDVQPAFDEGGNYIDVHFSPLTRYNPANGLLLGDYHLRTTSPLLGLGTKGIVASDSRLAKDIDGDARSDTKAVDMGADQVNKTGTGIGTLSRLLTSLFQGFLDFFNNSISAVVSFWNNMWNPPVAPPPIPNQPPAPTATAIATVMDKAGVTRVVPMDPNFADTFTYTLTTPPVNGTAVLSPTGIVTYTPNAGYLGADSLVVTVTDQGGLSGAATVAVTVTDMPPMPPTTIKLQTPPDTDGIDTDGDGIVDNDNVYLHLGAGDGFVKMADGSVQYCFGFSDLTNVPAENTMMEGMLGAEFSAPTIVAKEGQKLYLNLTNVGMKMRPDLFDPHTVHFHGFPQAAPVFDGNPEASFGTNMGATFTYFYDLVEPGTYMYHCHQEAAEHMQMGMLGSLYVMPKQNGHPHEYPAGSGRTYTKFVYNDGDGSTGYNVEYPVQIGSFDPKFHKAELDIQPLPLALMKDKYAMLNGRGYPDTVNPGVLTPPDENGNKPSQKISTLITATQGQRILLRISDLNVTRFYTLSSPGIPMTVVGVNARLLRSNAGVNMFYDTNSVTLGGGEAVDVIMDTASVAPGTYVLYTTNLNYLSNNDEDFGGMMTEIVIQ